MIFRFVLTNLKLYYIINFGQIKKKIGFHIIPSFSSL